MKKVRYMIFVFTLILTFVLSSCAAPTPLVIVVTATPAPPTEIYVEPTAVLAPVALAGPQSGATMKWIDGSTLAYIPLSEFIMGNEDFNAPIHNVTVDGYWIYTTKVTNRMFAQCVAVGACTPPAQEIGGAVYSNPEYANHPAIGVTWDQSQTYCAWTQGQLPTEAQWEKAARGDSGNLFPWGNADPACNILNFGYCNGSTSEVGAFKDGVSPYGLYDMAGNVFEWVSDWYSETYYTESAIVNPTGPESGEYRVVRGSSFESYPDQIALAKRHFFAPSNHRRDTGFRCVVLNPQPYAPFCQVSAFIPTGVISTNGCELPQPEVAGIYCGGGNSFATVDIPPGALFEADEDLQCSDDVIDGQRRLTCMGPKFKETTNEINVCNPNCSNSPDLTGIDPTCEPGYALDPANSVCNYAPIIGQVAVAGCPVGYKLLDRGGVQSCVISIDANGNCPTSTYFDTLAGLCIAPNGLLETPYGIDNPALASLAYAGCASGYTYSDTFQCCQAVIGGTYPGCAPGTKFDPTLGACSPGKIRLSGPGCVTLDVTTIRCELAINPCLPINNETSCIKTPVCVWSEKLGCVLR